MVDEDQLSPDIRSTFSWYISTSFTFLLLYYSFIQEGTSSKHFI